MPEHVHLLIDPRVRENAAENVLFHLKRPFAAMVLDRWRRLDAKILKRVTDKQGRSHFWLHSGGFDRNVRVGRLAETVHYVNQNPVERGLCATAKDWQWSSARFYRTGEKGMVAVVRAVPE
jgi:REP element-mobilizing transposase RayT